MMGTVVPETCCVYKKYNKTTSDIQFVLYSSVITKMHGPTDIRTLYVFRAGEVSEWLEPGRDLHDMNTDRILVKSRRKYANNAAEDLWAS